MVLGYGIQHGRYGETPWEPINKALSGWHALEPFIHSTLAACMP